MVDTPFSVFIIAQEAVFHTPGPSAGLCCGPARVPLIQADQGLLRLQGRSGT